MAGDALIEGLAVAEAAEVEGNTPAIFIEVGGEVVVANKGARVSWASIEAE